MLTSLGAVEGAQVVDLFAGTGAMGIEALSRRAAGVIFVERDHRAAQAIRVNLAAAGFGGRRQTQGGTATAQVVRADVVAWLGGRTAGEGHAGEGHADEGHADEGKVTDLALCDPPYRFSAWDHLLAVMRTGLAPALAVLEAAQPVQPQDGWGVLRVRRYGGTVVTVIELLAQRAQRGGPVDPE